MTMKLLAVTALFAGAAMVTSANATPLVKAGIEGGSTVTTVDYRRDDRHRDRDRDRRSWRRDDYERHGWHRFDRRPYDWRRRSCVAVGPVWFCP